MMRLAQMLWPLNRSLSGPGNHETLAILQQRLPALQLKVFRSGDQVFDWTVPDEWAIRDAKLIGPDGGLICSLSENNLRVVGYSEPIDITLSLDDLQSHLHSLPDQPDAIPYVTSYYQKSWGFCLSHQERLLLKNGWYRAIIDATLAPGVLPYGELLVHGKSTREVMFSTYICHPSMANNELSGPVLAAELAAHIEKSEPFYTYRFLFLPETIGSLAYLSSHLQHLKKSVLAGFVLTCVGDDREVSFLPSRKGGTVADKVALKALSSLGIQYRPYTWLDRGSDERQYCAPGIDLPVCSVMRSKYGTYPEYHTNLDTLGGVVTEKGLQGSFDIYAKIVELLESSRYPRATVLGEPQLGRRNLYPTLSIKGDYTIPRRITNVLSYSDGTLSIQQIAEKLNMPTQELMHTLDILKGLDLIEM